MEINEVRAFLVGEAFMRAEIRGWSCNACSFPSVRAPTPIR